MDSVDIYRAFHPKQQNTHSSQVHMEHPPGFTIFWDTKQALVNSFLNTTLCMRLEINYKEKKNTNIEVKKYATKQLMRS